MSKADFRAIREQIGASRAYIADILGVAERSVKRWEDPRYADPPDDAWELLNALKATQDEIVEYAIEFVEDIDAAEIQINYYRSQEQFDAYGRDEGDYNIANANARATARALETMGLKVMFAYPDEEGYVKTPRNPV